MLISDTLMPSLENTPKKVISKKTVKQMQKQKFGRAELDTSALHLSYGDGEPSFER
jgi:hypothetical protein